MYGGDVTFRAPALTSQLREGESSCSCPYVRSSLGEVRWGFLDVQTRRGKFPRRVPDVQNRPRKGWRSFPDVQNWPRKQSRRFRDVWTARTVAFYRTWDVVTGARNRFCATSTVSLGAAVGWRQSWIIRAGALPTIPRTCGLVAGAR